MDDKAFAKVFLTSKRNQFLPSCGPFKMDTWEKGKTFTLVRNGTCLKCVSCGATSGCS